MILHSYQNYALCFTFRFPLFYSRPMEWSEEHDELLLRMPASKKCFCNEERKCRSSLIEELVEREDTILAKAESELKQQLKDNETADDIRKKAMESLKEPKKRNSDEVGASRKCCRSRRGEPLVDFLQEKQRLTAKLDNSSYMQNNRNRKVSSK